MSASSLPPVSWISSPSVMCSVSSMPSHCLNKRDSGKVSPLRGNPSIEAIRFWFSRRVSGLWTAISCRSEEATGFLATSLNLPVVPVRLDGQFEMKQAGRKLPRRRRVTVSIGLSRRYPAGTPTIAICDDMEKSMSELHFSPDTVESPE